MITSDMQMADRYVGRFAPSPSGPLHMGSLVCALASWLDARHHKGIWLVRIEDIDPPREQPGADQLILRCLDAHGLCWDGEVMYQSQRSDNYRAALARLSDAGLGYRCSCTRARLKQLPGNYDRHCWHTPPTSDSSCAIRVHLGNALASVSQPLDSLNTFHDLILGPQNTRIDDQDDFIIHRKDGYFAYQLAVVVDDIAQGITQVIRGADLLQTTASQRLLFYLLGAQAPQYGHIPLVTDAEGNKLSKQNHAPAVDIHTPRQNLIRASHLLGIPPKPALDKASLPTILEWALQHWQPERIPKHSVPVQ